VPDQEAHVDGSIERIEDEIEIAVGGYFATVDAALESFIRLSTTGPQKAVTKGSDQLAIRLTSGEQRRHDLAALGAKDPYQPPHLKAHVSLHGSGIREAQFVIGAGGESVGDQGSLSRPPTVDSCFANVGVGGDGLNAQLRKSANSLQQFQGAAQDRLSRFFAAGPAGGTLCAASIVSVASVTSVSSTGATDEILNHG